MQGTDGLGQFLGTLINSLFYICNSLNRFWCSLNIYNSVLLEPPSILCTWVCAPVCAGGACLCMSGKLMCEGLVGVFVIGTRKIYKFLLVTCDPNGPHQVFYHGPVSKHTTARPKKLTILVCWRHHVLQDSILCLSQREMVLWLHDGILHEHLRRTASCSASDVASHTGLVVLFFDNVSESSQQSERYLAFSHGLIQKIQKHTDSNCTRSRAQDHSTCHNGSTASSSDRLSVHAVGRQRQLSESQVWKDYRKPLNQLYRPTRNQNCVSCFWRSAGVRWTWLISFFLWQIFGRVRCSVTRFHESVHQRRCHRSSSEIQVSLPCCLILRSKGMGRFWSLFWAETQIIAFLGTFFQFTLCQLQSSSLYGGQLVRVSVHGWTDRRPPVNCAWCLITWPTVATRTKPDAWYTFPSLKKRFASFSLFFFSFIWGCLNPKRYKEKNVWQNPEFCCDGLRQSLYPGQKTQGPEHNCQNDFFLFWKPVLSQKLKISWNFFCRRGVWFSSS